MVVAVVVRLHHLRREARRGVLGTDAGLRVLDGCALNGSRCEISDEVERVLTLLLAPAVRVPGLGGHVMLRLAAPKLAGRNVGARRVSDHQVIAVPQDLAVDQNQNNIFLHHYYLYVY